MFTFKPSQASSSIINLPTFFD